MNAKLETEIRELTDRFFEGTTTLEEERRLYDFFRQKDIPQDLEPYKDMFLDFSALALSERETGLLASATPGTSGQARPEKPQSARRSVLKYSLEAAAATILLAVLIGWGTHTRQERNLAARYEGSYMIVNGVRTDKLTRIRPEIERTLAEAERIEQNLSAEKLIQAAEADILNVIEDEKERERIRQLME